MNSAAGERREIEYAVHGGVSLKGHLYAPQGPGKFPLVIAVHGGGWRLANLDNYRTLGPWLAELAGEHALFREGNAADPHGRMSTAVKVCVPIYAVLDLARQWRHDQISRPRDQIVEKFLGASLIDDRRVYFDASPLSYVSARNNATAFLLAWGTADDVVDHEEQGEAFLEALKQAGHYVRSVVVAGAPHFWIGDPIDEPGSHSGFFAPRLLRFLQARL